jgi:hypothetical protein
VKYQAKIVELKPADPGYAYPTYEYLDEHGHMQRVTDDNAQVIQPWDMVKTHKIKVDEHGSIDHSDPRGLIVAIIFMALFFTVGIAGSALGSAFFGIVMILVSLLPFFLMKGSIKESSRRKRAMKQLEPIQGKIIWYKEVTKRSKNSTHTYHYPVVEYLYNGQTFHSVLHNSEDPIHEGETREFYLDIEHEDAFMKEECNNGGRIVSLVFTFCFTIPFLLAGIGIMAPDLLGDMFEWCVNLLNNTQRPSTAPNMDEIGSYIAVGMVVFMIIIMAIPTIKEVAKLLQMLKAKKEGQHVYAAYTKTNDYGRADVQMYEYTYNGQLCKYQTRSFKHEQQIELFIHPNTGKAYAQYDITVQIVKFAVLGGMIVLTSLMSMPFWIELI